MVRGRVRARGRVIVRVRVGMRARATAKPISSTEESATETTSVLTSPTFNTPSRLWKKPEPKNPIPLQVLRRKMQEYACPQ